MLRVAASGAVLAATGCVARTPEALPELRAAPQVALPGQPPRHAAAVRYGNGVLVAISPEGAAAIDFVEPFTHDGVGVRYRYRFAPRHGTAAEVAGEGMVREKFESDPGAGGAQRRGDRIALRHMRDAGSVTRVTAGAVEFEWSVRNRGSGWIYFDPTAIRMKVASGWEYENLDLRGER